MGFQTSSVKLGWGAGGGQKGPLGSASEVHGPTILLRHGAGW